MKKKIDKLLKDSSAIEHLMLSNSVNDVDQFVGHLDRPQILRLKALFESREQVRQAVNEANYYRFNLERSGYLMLSAGVIASLIGLVYGSTILAQIQAWGPWVRASFFAPFGIALISAYDSCSWWYYLEREEVVEDEQDIPDVSELSEEDREVESAIEEQIEAAEGKLEKDQQDVGEAE